MRLNKYIALASGLSRRAADAAIADGRVRVNDQLPSVGHLVADDDIVTLDNRAITPAVKATIMLNKPVGYVCSRNGQGSATIYDLLPAIYHHLKPIGRLDKASSGLLLLTNDGELAHELTHPSKRKLKIYRVTLDKPLQPLHRQMINDFGIMLEDGVSQLNLERQHDDNHTDWIVRMSEGRNRQIRRTFAAVGYDVVGLHREHFGHYELGSLSTGKYKEISI